MSIPFKWTLVPYRNFRKCFVSQILVAAYINHSHFLSLDRKRSPTESNKLCKHSEPRCGEEASRWLLMLQGLITFLLC